MMSYFNKVHHMAAPVGRQTTSGRLSSSECSTGGKVCYLKMLVNTKLDKSQLLQMDHAMHCTMSIMLFDKLATIII